MIRKNFTNNIREIRLKRGYTIAELASLTGVSRNSISSMEKQEFQPSAYTAYKLCDALDVYFEQLFDLEVI